MRIRRKELKRDWMGERNFEESELRNFEEIIEELDKWLASVCGSSWGSKTVDN